jgi:hypothetical protein
MFGLDLPPTAKRVSINTCPHINEKIRNDTKNNLLHIKSYTKRIDELNREWDTERVLETTASLIILAGSVWGLLSHKKWFILTGAIATFLLQHALQGWCPPLPFIRKFGIRTADEIFKERFAVKYFRNDFENLDDMDSLIKALEKD